MEPMKNILHSCLGLSSSFFLMLGLVQIAELVDPMRGLSFNGEILDGPGDSCTPCVQPTILAAGVACQPS
jgi:hypothetical protein